MIWSNLTCETHGSPTSSQEHLLLIIMIWWPVARQVYTSNFFFSKYWFVSGLWKIEHETKKGGCVFLSPKCYIIRKDDDPKEAQKIATKGVHADDQLSYDDFINSLYSNTRKTVNQINLRMNKAKDRMALLEQNKTALNNIFTKLHVLDDHTTIIPHTLGSTYLWLEFWISVLHNDRISLYIMFYIF